ncbi:MAG: phosphopantothenoylcysteine decarboxylase, partial [Bacteroidales bacterium]|nr:phosphopantothenoylcysteine decarboxylase [Bacteroidales bacterium]
PMSARPKAEPFETIQVSSAMQMYGACMEIWPKADIGILSAAVADYTPETTSPQKIKKTDADLNLKLIRTHDILKELGQHTRPHQYLAGFALETENEIAHAQAKLKAKNADLIVLNSLRDAGAGFGTPTNRVCLLDRNGDIAPQELQGKEEVAARIADYIETKLTK